MIFHYIPLHCHYIPCHSIVLKYIRLVSSQRYLHYSALNYKNFEKSLHYIVGPPKILDAGLVETQDACAGWIVDQQWSTHIPNISKQCLIHILADPTNITNSSAWSCSVLFCLHHVYICLLYSRRSPVDTLYSDVFCRRFCHAWTFIVEAHWKSLNACLFQRTAVYSDKETLETCKVKKCEAVSKTNMFTACHKPLWKLW